MELTKSFVIDGDKIKTLKNQQYDGLGMVSANNSSRLLLDYKSEHPEVYEKLLNYMFGEDGLCLNLLKVEMGSDCNSSSGTEPAVKRTADEIADVKRGAGYQFAKDALAVNPLLKVDLLPWGIPGWVAKAEDKNAAKYQWYKQTIDALYDTYGVKVSYVTATQNEKANDYQWIKYLAKALKSEEDGRYDYSTIRIVAGEGVCNWEIADEMLKDEELLNSVDVVSAHYTSFVDDSAKKLQQEYGKMLWFSEGASPMSFSRVTYKYDSSGTGLSDINGMLDIATRLTQAFTEGMTMYEFQPVVSAYYDGVCYCSKQLITANEPWNGAYDLDTGYYMGLHFSQFLKPGWGFVSEACFGDGKTGGDGHAMVDSTYNYVTAISPDKSDITSILVNQSDKAIKYEITIDKLPAINDKINNSKISIWETRANSSEKGDYYAIFLNKKEKFSIKENQYGKTSIIVKLEPYSIMTITTLQKELKSVEKTSLHGSVLSLPYSDDFEYKERPDSFLLDRGNAPLYTTDQEGAFEIALLEGNHVLMQMITEDTKPEAWAGCEKPTTNLGDDRWHNYRVSVDVHFADVNTDATGKMSEQNYVGIGARYIQASATYSGYWVKLCCDGSVLLMKKNEEVAKGSLGNIDLDSWHTLSLAVEENIITAKADDVEITYTDDMGICNSGRIALYSDYAKNYFDKLMVEAIDSHTYIERLDELEAGIEFSAGSSDKDKQGWYFNTTSGFNFYKRTCAEGKAGDYFTYRFNGGYCAFTGVCEDVSLMVTVDGATRNIEKINCGERSCFFATDYMKAGEHEIKVEILAGTLTFDSVEIER